MYAAPACFHAHGVLEVKHLVVEEILDGAARCVGAVEGAADNDGVVRGVVVAEHAAGVVGAPGKDGTAQQAVKEARVERFEDLVKVEVMALRGEDALAAACLTDMLGLAGDGLGGDVAAVAVGVGRRDWLLVQLGEKDVCNGVVDGFGRVLEQVRESDVEAAFAQANRGVQRGEAAKA